MNETARACAPLGYSAAADASRSASSAVIRASLSFRALTSAAKARSISSVGRRLAAGDAPLLFAGGAARHTTDRATPKPPPPVQKKSTPDRQTSRRRRRAAISAPPLVRLVRAFERGEPRIVQRRALAGRGDESASRLKLKRRGGGRAAALAAAGGGDRGGRTAHARGRIAEHAWSSASRSPAVLRIALRVELHDGRVTAHALLGRLRLGEKEKRGMRI